jgi:hypothetical protein
LFLNEKELLDRLAAAGHAIPPSRLAKWRERGLVPTMGRPSRGHGKGRAAHAYPEIAVEQAVAIAQLLDQGFNFEEIGWRLWVGGYAVARRYWFDVFAAAAKEFDEVASVLRCALDSDELEAGPIEDMANKIWEAKTNNRLLKNTRKSLGRERFPAIVFQVAQMWTGQFVSVSTQQDPDNAERHAASRAMDIALGLAHAKTDTVNDVGPIISGDYSSVLHAVFEPLANNRLSEFLKIVDLDRLRRSAKSMIGLTQSIAAASQEFNRAIEKDAFGLNRVAMLAESDRNQQAITALLWALITEQSQEQFHDVGAMAQLFSAAATAAKNYPDASSGGPNMKSPKFRRKISKKPAK